MRTITQALSHPMFTIVTREETPGIFKIRFGEIPTVITIKITQLPDGWFVLTASHTIMTEPQGGPYLLPYRIYGTPGEAIDDFRNALSVYYKAAERQGYSPSESWLVQRAS
jgi:hypothetical protein